MSVAVKVTLDYKKGGEDGVEKTIIESCLKVQAQAVALAPVDTANLRNSIGYVTTRAKDGDLTVRPAKMEGYVGTPVFYGVYQEFGTRRMAPQPFLRPAAGALSTDLGAVKKIMVESMKKYEKGIFK